MFSGSAFHVICFYSVPYQVLGSSQWRRGTLSIWRRLPWESPSELTFNLYMYVYTCIYLYIHACVYTCTCFNDRKMRRKEEASQVKQTTRQSNTAHPRQSPFLRKISIYTYMYMCTCISSWPLHLSKLWYNLSPPSPGTLRREQCPCPLGNTSGPT